MMKKYLLIVVSFLLLTVAANATNINKALLQHNGEVTLFDGDNMQDAVNAAADGDTIYLTLGTFKPFIVSKKITIRGTGETTIIDGDVDISIPGTQKLTSPVLEALAVSGTVSVKSAVNDLIIRKCKIANMNINATIDGAVLDRNYITNTLTLSQYIKGMTVVNTKLYQIKASGNATNNTTFVNCNMKRLFINNFAGTIINSIIYGSCRSDGSYGSYLSTDEDFLIASSVILNSLINTNTCGFSSSSVRQNCYSDFYNLSNDLECSYTKAQLQSNGFLGTDGTVVGIEGGDTPFTLKPSVPTVTSSSLNIDNEKKELNVKLTVSPE